MVPVRILFTSLSSRKFLLACPKTRNWVFHGINRVSKSVIEGIPKVKKRNFLGICVATLTLFSTVLILCFSHPGWETNLPGTLAAAKEFERTFGRCECIRSDLDNICDSPCLHPGAYVRVSSYGGNLHVFRGRRQTFSQFKEGRFYQLLNLLKKLNDEQGLPDFDAVFSLIDHVAMKQCNQTCRPFFTIAKTAEEKHLTLLFPDPEYHDWGSKLQEIQNVSSAKKFEDKQNKGLWRGRNTDYHSKNSSLRYVDRSWILNGRAQLSNLSNYYPHLVDAGFTSLVEQYTSPSVASEMRDLHVFREYMNLEQMLGYRFLIVPDGNTYARFFKVALASNSVAIKQSSMYQTFISLMLTASKDYIEVKRDFSDLVEVLKYLTAHQSAAAKFLSKSEKTRYKVLSVANVNNYMIKILEALSNSYCNHGQIQRNSDRWEMI